MRRFNRVKQAILAAFIATVFSFGGANRGARPTQLYRAYGSGTQRSDSQSRRIEGRWEGTLDAGAAKLILVLHLVGKDEHLSATLDSPDQGATGLPIDTVSITGDSVRFEMKSLGAAYEGKLTKGDSQIEGEWKQQGQAIPLVFKRSAETGTAQ